MNDLIERFKKIRTLTEEICQPLEPEDFVPQPITDVSPPKWHLGHTSWFFEVFILEVYQKEYKTYNPEFHYIFNSYYESHGKRILRATRGNMSRPSLEEILHYRKHVTENMISFLEKQKEPDPKLQMLLNIGMNHEQQHQELLIYDIKFILGNNPLFPSYCKPKNQSYGNAVSSANYLEIDAGVYQLGHDKNKNFCFDNETPRHKTYLNPFKIQDRLVTTGEYLEFIEAGAYQSWEYWLEEGWSWIKENNIYAPLYWHKTDQDWWHYTLNGLCKLGQNIPVSHISYFEAEAYARWKGKRLPFENEWEIAALKLSPEIIPESNFLDKGLFETSPKENESCQFWGDCWEWTMSSYLPYPGYQQDKGALGEYNGKFMINQMVLKGGSYATPRDHFRPTYRNFFHTDKQWMISGFRLAETVQNISASQKISN